MVKLNIDSNALENPGGIGAGGILRGSQGDFIYAFAIPMGEGTNNQDEIDADIFCLSWCLQLGYTKVILEVDSELIIKWINQQAKSPWQICHLLDKLQNIIIQFQVFRCRHTFREANFTPDVLSKFSHKCTSPHLYFSRKELPKEARAYYDLDKMEMINFRRTKMKKI